MSHQFTFTGFSPDERLKLCSIIKKLNGVLICAPFGQKDFPPECTHLVAKKPCKSFKYLSALATGKWIVVDEFLLASSKAGSWCSEDEYEWSKKYVPAPMRAFFTEAPRRWRQSIAKSQQGRPFCGWKVGLKVQKKNLETFTKLLEIGGGTAENVDTGKEQNFTIILVYQKFAEEVRQYHDRGIPCVPCNYLADRLLKDPPPAASHCSIFSSQQLTLNSSCFVKLSKCDDLLSPTSLRKLTTDPTSSLHPGGEDQHPKEEGFVFSQQRMKEEPSQDKQLIFPASGSLGQKSSFPEDPSDQESRGSRDIFTPIQDQPLKEKSHLLIQESLNLHQEELHLPIRDKPPLYQEESHLPILIPCESLDSDSDTQEEIMTSHSRDDVAMTSPNCKKIVWEDVKEDAGIFEEDADYVHLEFLEDIQIPQVIKDQKKEIEDFLKKMSTVTLPIETIADDVTKTEERRVFGSVEMSMLEKFADHPRSLLFICSKLLSLRSYPPPQLLYVVINKLILESSNQHEADSAFKFLVATLALHPPNSPHIRHDDVYSKAIGMTSSHQSTFLTAAGAKRHEPNLIWNQFKKESNEWSLLSTVLSGACDCSAPQRQYRTFNLLSFLTIVLEQNDRLLRHTFWPRSSKCALNSATKRLFKHYRYMVEKVAAMTSQQSNSESDEEFLEEEILDESSLGENPDKGDNSSENLLSCDDVTREVTSCFTRIVVAMATINCSGSSDVTVMGLVEAFRDADHVTLRRLFVGFPNFLTIRVASALLRNTCKSDLVRADIRGETSLHVIVNGYFRLLPIAPDSIAKDWSPNIVERSPDNTNPDQQGGSSDKENSKESPSSHPISVSKLTNSNVNKRNAKGETPLHRACMLGQPGRVAQLLGVPGVEPNVPDHAGWTPLHEACNHGHLECARALLKLPLAAKATPGGDKGTSPMAAPEGSPQAEGANTPTLAIDLLACPEEGTTALHDALNNGHIEIARLLMEKGGVELLYVVDKQGKTPLEVCVTDEVRSLVLEIACHIAALHFKPINVMETDEVEGEVFLQPISAKEYNKFLPPPSLMTSPAWTSTCFAWIALLRHLLIAYVTENRLLDIMTHITAKGCQDNTVFEQLKQCDVTEGSLLRTQSDLSYVTKWRQVEEWFLRHARMVTGRDGFQLDEDFELFVSSEIEDFVRLLND